MKAVVIYILLGALFMLPAYFFAKSVMHAQISVALEEIKKHEAGL